LYLGCPLVPSLRRAASVTCVLEASQELYRPTTVLMLLYRLNDQLTLSIGERYFNAFQKNYIVRLSPRFIRCRFVSEVCPDTSQWYVNYETDESPDEANDDDEDANVDNEEETDDKQETCTLKTTKYDNHSQFVCDCGKNHSSETHFFG
jgi:hypothetical protein